MHNAAFAALGIRADYQALDVAPSELDTKLQEIRDGRYLGANVSVPHKEQVARLMDELSPEAAAIGAVNTVVRQGVVGQGARLVGHNSDAAGFGRALSELPEIGDAGLVGSNCLVLGAGGAARAVVWELVRAGASVRVVNRDPRRASALVTGLEAAGMARGAALALPGSVGSLAAVDLLINTTTVGMSGGPEPLGVPLLPAATLATLAPAAAVVDLVYRPALTPLLLAAAARGHTIQNGLPMLVWQGAAAFELWTGRSAPVSVLRAAAAAGLAAG